MFYHNTKKQTRLEIETSKWDLAVMGLTVLSCFDVCVGRGALWKNFRPLGQKRLLSAHNLMSFCASFNDSNVERGAGNASLAC